MEESALDVLSRAATMLQEQSPLHLTNDEPKQATKQLPSSKWKRDRRTSQYGRKSSDPQPPKPSDPQQHQPTTADSSRLDDTPLDMSVRQRGLPPSYSQAISDPSFRSSYKSVPADGGAAVVSSTTAPTTAQAPPSVNGHATSAGRDEIPSGISMCDPIIDEHFRRSLGKAYMTVFNNNNNNGQQSQQTTNSKDSVTSSNNTNKQTSPIPNNVQSSTVKTAVNPPKPNNIHNASDTLPHDSNLNNSEVNGETTNQAIPSRRVTIVNSSTNVSDLMDGEGLSVDDHFAKALGETWLKLNGKKEASSSENGVLKTANGVVENGSVSSLVTI